MPWGWIVFKTTPAANPNPSTSSNPGLPTDPVELEEYVRWVVDKTGKGAKLVALYFEIGADLAHAIVQDLDDYYDARAVSRVLHATRYTKLLDPPQARQAQGLERGLRPPRKRSPAKKRPRS